jgi:hypothetical protein
VHGFAKEFRNLEESKERETTMASRRSGRRVWLIGRGIRVAAVAALLGSGVLAAAALASTRSAQAQRQAATITTAVTGPTTSSATTGPTTTTAGSNSAPKGAWMTFEVNPPSFALRPLRRFADCVRRHGVPSLPDPKVVDGKVVLMLPRGLTARSPRLRQAQRACQKLLPQGAITQPGTGTGPTTTRPGG